MTSQFFTAEDFEKAIPTWAGVPENNELRRIVARHANAKLERFLSGNLQVDGKVVVDAKEWKHIEANLVYLAAAYGVLSAAGVVARDLLNRNFHDFEETGDEKSQSLFNELESLRALKAKVDAAPWVYICEKNGIKTAHLAEPVDAKYRAKLLDPEEIK